MHVRAFVSVRALVVVVGGVLMAPVPAATQSPAPTAGTWAPPRTPDGQPDLQGIWDFRTITPLERPQEYAGRELLTDEEIAQLNREAEGFASSERRPELTPERDVGLAYNQFWWDRGQTLRRTALIVDPPEARIPYRAEALAKMETPEAVRREDARRGRAPARSWEDMDLADRCILGFNSGPPMVPGGYNQNVQIFQTADTVAILNEMVHDTRIIPLDGRAHLAPHLRQWTGDSRAHWEGNTLVVDTINFLRETSFTGSTAKLHLVERFTRADADTLLYEFTVEDPTTWSRPWTAQIPMRKTEAPLFEYACHEGNYGMTNLLRGSRAHEAAASAP